MARIVMPSITYMRTNYTCPEWTSHRITARFDCYLLNLGLMIAGFGSDFSHWPKYRRFEPYPVPVRETAVI